MPDDKQLPVDRPWISITYRPPLSRRERAKLEYPWIVLLEQFAMGLVVLGVLVVWLAYQAWG